MEPYALLRLVVFPLATLGLLALGMFLGARILLPAKKQEELNRAHWTLQNRAFWNVHLYGSFLRLFSNFLVGVVIVYLVSAHDIEFTLPALIALLVIGMLVTVPPFSSFRNHVRRRWERIDLNPYRGRIFLSLLFFLPLLFLIVAVPTIPREVSLASVLFIGFTLAFLIAWQAWGGVWLSRKLGTLTPAPEKWKQLVVETAKEMGVDPLPRVFVANTAMLNAFAYPTGHAVFFTRPLLETLPEEQIRALAEHELGHLQEGTGSHLLRVSQPLIYFPILCLNPLASHFDFPVALFISLGGFFLASRLYARFLRKAEFEADTAGPDEESSSTDLAEALTRLHQENLIPAVLPRGGFKSHPDLYDRLLALGVTPDYERPPVPVPALMAMFAFAWILICGILLIALEIAIWWFWA